MGKLAISKMLVAGKLVSDNDSYKLPVKEENASNPEKPPNRAHSTEKLLQKMTNSDLEDLEKFLKTSSDLEDLEKVLKDPTADISLFRNYLNQDNDISSSNTSQKNVTNVSNIEQQGTAHTASGHNSGDNCNIS